jgi:hypothetical protein
MRGVYLVAAELAGRECIVSTTSRNALGADLLVTDAACQRAYSVQVKTNAKPASFWLVNKHATQLVSPTLIYVFVNLRESDPAHEYFVVPSSVVAAQTRVGKGRGSTWYYVRKSSLRKHQDAWDLFDTTSKKPLAKRTKSKRR